MRRPTVLSLSLQLVFPGATFVLIFKARVHWQSLLSKMSAISKCEIALLTLLGNEDHFYLGLVTLGGQSKYSSDYRVSLSLVFLP
jgi:hypothetical protein